MNKILLIGPRQNKTNLSDTGGISILFELLISELVNKKVNFTIIDTLKANYSSSIQMFFKTISILIKDIPKHDHITLHATMNSFLIFAPIIIIIAKVFSKTTSLRKFAGSFDNVYNDAGFLKKHLIRFILKNIDVVFFETKYLVRLFKKNNPNTFWFPNVRDSNIQIKKERIFCKKFVYIGSINEEKGIDELCEVIKQLDNSYTCDIYGPIKFKNEKYSIEYFKKMKVCYKGPLVANEVLKVLDTYNILILPSHREGYPGIIIEAFALGIPVIATKLSGIMEMCEHQKNSLLIDVKQPQQLLAAILSIKETNYQQLHQEVKKSFINFDSHIQTNLFLERIGYKLEKL